MRSRSLASRTLTLPLVLMTACGVLLIDMAPAEAGRRIRVRSTDSTPATPTKSNETAKESSGSSGGSRFFGRSSSSAAASEPGQEEKTQLKLSAAARAAARAQTALEGEQAQRARSGKVYEPVPAGKTLDYSGGVSCVAGC